ncbi:MAG: glycoside hydrolase family 99-like domain-containing protein [Cyanobacteriota bacterium]|jgi:lipopolysaccharide biosynthesis protein
MNPKLIAFHLPQYHPIPENNEWWGEGFTEWRNVVSAQPLFKGHYQPHLPADLGFYDLRLPEVRIKQASLAQQYGIYGFCYYHYWFNGQELLERPVREILLSGEPNQPFCLCWANENWTRRWDGMDHEVLIAQNYSSDDDISHFMALLPYFKDSRYIKIDNKPLILIYRSSLLPDSVHTTSLWRKLAIENDLDGLYLVKVESFPEDRNRNPQLEGFDAALDFTPDGTHAPPTLSPGHKYELLKKFRLRKTHPFSSNSVYLYSEFVEFMLRRRRVNYPRFPCVFPAWDNSSRRKNSGASIIHGSTPSLYGKWLKSVLADHLTLSNLPEPFVFINAWNEWAEGCHLEPDLRWGHAYLEQTRDALRVNSV